MKTSLYLVTAIATFAACGAACADEQAVEEIVVTAKRVVRPVDEVVVTAKRPGTPVAVDLAAAARRALDEMPLEIDAPTIDAPEIEVRVAFASEGRLTAGTEPQLR